MRRRRRRARLRRPRLQRRHRRSMPRRPRRLRRPVRRPSTSRCRRRARAELARSHRRSVRRLLPVRVRRLDGEERDPRGPRALGPVRRDRRAQQGRAQARCSRTTRRPARPIRSRKKLGDFYALVHGRGGDREGRASRAIKPLLDKIAKVKDAKSWLDRARPSSTRPASTWCGASARARLQGLDDERHAARQRRPRPARSRLLPEAEVQGQARRVHGARRQDARAREHAGRGRAADDVVAIETELAKVTKTARRAARLPARYNPTDAQGPRASRSSRSTGPAYFKALGFTPSAKIIVGTPKFFAAIDELRTKFKPAQWASYFTYHVLDGLAIDAAEGVRRRGVRARRRSLTGVEKQPERCKRCIDATTGALGELLGQQYADKYFPAAAKQTAIALVDAIVAVDARRPRLASTGCRTQTRQIARRQAREDRPA